jgi:predicted MFS family arabinose efflux permease
MLGLDYGTSHTWDSPLTIALLTAAPVFLGGFLVVETMYAKEPVAPPSVLFERTSFACLVCNFCSYGAWLALIYYLPLYWQAVEGLSATQAGLRLLPGIGAVVCGSLFAGFVSSPLPEEKPFADLRQVMQRTGKYYTLTLGCYIGATLAFIPIILSTGFLFHSLPGIWAGLVLCGFSTGIGGTSTLVALISNAQPEDQATAIGCMYLFRSLGSTIGISLSAAVIQESLKEYLRQGLPAYLDVEDIVKHVLRNLEFVKTLPVSTREIVAGCYEKATRWGFVGDAVLVTGALVAAAMVRERRLER